MEKEQTESILDSLKEKKVQEAIGAGFSEKQARWLVDKLGFASLGFGGLFM